MFTRHCGLCVLLLALVYNGLVLTEKIGCKDEENKDVDWYINYKLPEVDDKDQDLSEGAAYAYILAPGSKEWTLSDENVDSGSMLEATLKTYYDNKEDLTYLLYNDDTPGNGKKSSTGHLKGVLAFDGETGFWLVHSIPNFPHKSKYEYPETALKYGQTALCVTFKTSELNKIANQLLFSNPNTYAYKLSKDVEKVLNDTAQSLFSKKPKSITKEPFVSEEKLKSLGGTEFISFAKDNQGEEDLYSDIIAPALKTSLVVETWRKGAGGIMKRVCENQNVVDVQSIEMEFESETHVSFEYTKDHSKWAISDDDDNNYVCIADLNRMPSQKKRGGGALCFESSSVKEAFDSIIASADEC